jgi:DMSO/TMAO reductase YedYZ molybdopterin-dependent catalytic subunit
MDAEFLLRRRTAILVSATALVAALAAGHLVAGIVDPDAAPVVAVGNAVRDLSPAALTEYAIGTLGAAKLPLLFGGIAAALLGVAVLAGLLSRRDARPGMAIAAVVGLAGLLAALIQPTVSTLGLLAPAASLVTGVLTFRWLHRLASGRRRNAVRGTFTAFGNRRPRHSEGDPAGAAGAPPAEHPATGPAPSRRRFLLTTAGVAVGAGMAGGAGELLARRIDVEASRRAVGALVPARPAPPIPAGADFASVGTPRFLTRSGDFYRVDTALVSVPRVRAEDWSLRVHGRVEREREYRYADLRDRDLVERTITMTCVSNQVGGPYVSTANFVGVPLRDLLTEAGVRPGADQLFSTSVDGWTAGTPTEAALDPDRGALLALGMNGEPLPVEHGFPARLVVPGLYGFVSATKWVVDLELTTFDARRSYWRERRWGQYAPIKTQSRIDAPRGLSSVPAGDVTIAGVAWSQNVGIDRVEVRIDDGEWQSTRLSTEVNNQTWRMWQQTVELPPGIHRAQVRATDRAGQTQQATRVPPIPDGATGWHSIQFTVSG